MEGKRAIRCTTCPHPVVVCKVRTSKVHARRISQRYNYKINEVNTPISCHFVLRLVPTKCYGVGYLKYGTGILNDRDLVNIPALEVSLAKLGKGKKQSIWLLEEAPRCSHCFQTVSQVIFDLPYRQALFTDSRHVSS